tara:strand:- start:751 stop:1518 length:768 start_codon:yes stop_codon:yes gene_type:complete
MRVKDKQNVGRSERKLSSQKKILKEKNRVLDKLSNNFQTLKNKQAFFSSRQSITRILYYNEIYKNIINKPGIIMEFGVECGATLSLLTKLRGIYEPYNFSRKIVGFDTFNGFSDSLIGDEKKLGWKRGDYSTPKNFEKSLEKILLLEEMLAPLSHIKKFELVKGDASETVGKYIKKNPQTIIGIAIFDMDIYKPTKDVLLNIKNRLFKGSILVFDELNDKDFPGETLALLEVLGMNNLKLNSFHGETFGCWAIIE